MRTLPRWIPFLLLFFASSVAAAQTSADDEKDVRAIGRQLQDAWNKGDARMLADSFLTDGDYIGSTGRTARGRAEVEKAFASQWSGIYKGTKLTHTVTSVRFVRRDVAIADGAFDITGMRDSGGKPIGTRSGLSTLIAVKKGDRWYVAALRGMVPSLPEGVGGK
jgi:uncharacterized protein (TIGR02246 family)